MKCHVCGAENPDDAFFCGNCGAQLSSLLSGGDGPVQKIGGDIELKPLIDEPVSTTDPAEPPQPSPAPPPRIDLNKPSAGLDTGGQPQRPPAPSQMHRPAQSGGAPQPPPPPPAYPGAKPSSYQPPAAYHAPSPPPYGQPSGYPPGYGRYPPADGNTSGMGPGYPVPPEASGWTFAGCVPFGLFAFLNGSIIWGLVALAGFIPYIGAVASLVYLIYIGVAGRELAWRSRKFADVQQFSETMNSWNIWGIALGIALLLLAALLFFFVFAVIFASAMHV